MVLDLTPDRELTICSEDGIRRIKAGSVVLCTGCRERTRGAIRIPGTRPAGVFTAGVVQEYMNLRNILVGRKAVILGSGDIGLIMARRLTLEGVKVECVAEILPYPSGLARNIVQCLDDFDIPLYLSTTVVDIHGVERLQGVTLAQIGPKGGVVRGTKRFIDCDTLLLSVGLIPENELAKKAGIDLSPVTTGPIVDDQFQTSVPGIFCGGNALQVHDLVDYASMESQKAGQSAATFAGAGKLPDQNIDVQPGNGIRYVVPQTLSGEEAVDFSMRVFSPGSDRYVVFRRGDKMVRRMKQTELDPAAMIRVRVRADRFKGSEGPLTVEVTD
jgi:NADPH-dependent 2,4-dienoyl-CoA reductase/sulfur reductase-like enzyme